ncbi:MAG: ribonuclease D, partial [Halioglobus sp.]|nr:ribonuclease D [Halioglobus sp.]
MSWEWLETSADLADVLDEHADVDAVMVDTEFMRQNTFYPQVALVQLCFDLPEEEPRAFLVDPLAIEDPEPLARLFADRRVVKVLHSPSEDLEVFRHWLGVLPQPLFDTQRAAALVDLGFGMGYRNLVAHFTGVELPKGETRSNWLKRPLTESQCHYAAQDVTYLRTLWRELKKQTGAADKYDWVLADGSDAIDNAMTLEERAHNRAIKGAWKLPHREQALLAALSAWRERTARSRDKPRNWILDDKACVQIASRQPGSVQQLKACVDLPPPVLRRHADEIIEVLAAQGEICEADWPPPQPAPLSAAQRDRVKQLKGIARELAGELQIAPEILLSGQDFELLLREAAGETVTPPPHW